MITVDLTRDEAEKIVKTAEMFFQKQGFDNTTLKDIIAHLKITESKFYCYFHSTDEILDLLWNDSSRHQ